MKAKHKVCLEYNRWQVQGGVGTWQYFYTMGLANKMTAEYKPLGQCFSINDASS